MPTPVPEPVPRDLPIESEDLLLDLVDSATLDQRAGLTRLFRILDALTSLDQEQGLGDLRRAYAPFSPDLEHVRAAREGEDKELLRTRLHQGLARFLEDANFRELSRAQIDAHVALSSPRGLALSVDFDDYAQLVVWARGTQSRIEEVRDWRRLWLRSERHEVLLYRRLFLAVELEALEPRAQRMAAADGIPLEKARKRVHRARAHLGDRVDAGHLFLKLFRDVPQADLESLLPNTKIRMRTFDKLRLSVLGGGGTIGGLVGTLGKLGAAASPMTWGVALVGVCGLLWRQVTKVLFQRTKYLADLNSRLYFLNLDNGWGAVTHLARMAQGQELREAMLAYTFTLGAGDDGLTRAELDSAVESWLLERYGLSIDFEIDDGLADLTRLGLVESREAGGGDPRLVALAPDAAYRRLVERWDDAFVCPPT